MNSPRLSDPLQLLAFGFGSGLLPKAPGTWGSLTALAFFPLLAMLPFWAYVLAVVLAALAGIAICAHAAKALDVHDDGRIVWDEFVGQWIALLPLAPLLTLDAPGVLWVLLGFGLFRLFDVWKPWPISWLDRHVHGGLGIMVDDLVAGLFAAAVLWLAVWSVLLW